MNMQVDRREMLRMGAGLLLTASLPASRLLAAEEVSPAVATDCLISTLDGKTHTGRLHSLKDGQVSFGRNGSEHVLDLSSVLEISVVEPATVTAASEVLTLSDGSTLPLREVLYNRDGFRCSSAEADSEIKVPGQAHAVQSVQLLDLPQSALQSWSDLQQKKERLQDCLVLLNTAKGTLDWIEGYVEAIAPETVRFHFDGSSYEVKRSRSEKQIAGVFFRTLPASLQKPEATGIGELKTASGASVAFTEITVERGVLNLKGAAGLELTTPLSGVGSIDLSKGKVFPLDSLRVLQISFVDETSKSYERRMLPAVNQSALGGPLRLANTAYSEGLSLQGGCEIVFQLPANAARFKGLAGIDPSIQSDASSVLRISGIDSRTEKLITELNLKTGATPESIEADLSNYRRLKIAVDPGNDLSFGDIINIADASVWIAPQ